MLPRRIKDRKPIRQSDRIRCPGHLAFIRKHHCIVPGCNVAPTVAHHVKMGWLGKGITPDDDRALALCNPHHTSGPDAIHRIGERQFEWLTGIDLLARAAEFAAKSDPLRRYLARKRAA